MSEIQEFLDLPRDFLKDGVQFVNRCQKPDRKEFIKIAQAVGVGFVVMGVRSTSIPFPASRSGLVDPKPARSRSPLLQTILTNMWTQTIGYLVKLIHIPLNNILVGGA